MTAEEIALEEFRRAAALARLHRGESTVAEALGNSVEQYAHFRLAGSARDAAASLARIIRAIRAERERLLYDMEASCENTPWPGCECPGCMTARERAMEEA